MNNISYVLAAFVLFLAAATWFFDSHLKQREAACHQFCELAGGQGNYSPAGHRRRAEGTPSRCDCTGIEQESDRDESGSRAREGE